MTLPGSSGSEIILCYDLKFRGDFDTIMCFTLLAEARTHSSKSPQFLCSKPMPSIKRTASPLNILPYFAPMVFPLPYQKI